MKTPSKRRLRIGQASNCPLVGTQGSGYIITGFATHMRARGHEVHAVGPEHYLSFGKATPALRLRKLIGITRAALSLASGGALDVLELWGAECWLATALLARRTRRPLLVHRSNGLEPHVSASMMRAGAGNAAARSRRFAPGTLFDRLQRPELAFRRADALTVVSDFDGDFARQRGYQPAGRLQVIENPLEDSWIGGEFSTDRAPLIGYCGSWIRRKGIDVVREAFAQLPQRLPGVRFLVCGVGSQFDPARELPGVATDRLEVVPFASREELAAIYRRLSLLVNPSWFESFGLVSAEAMACGTPVIATRTGFAASWTDGREGWLVPFGDAAALADRVVRVQESPDERAAVARRAWTRVQNLRWGDAARQLEDAYSAWLRAREVAA